MVGIICEYNPFHNGHIYHLNKVKELFPNEVITLVLVGNFLNRGDVSIINKWDKTKLALDYGIDLVVELPFAFATQSADIYAYGAISILDNLKLVNEKVTLETAREVCKKAYIDDYIMSLPKQYDTIIGEGGINLSGGQKQRIAIARTLLQNTKIILFDEATSSLDNASQEYIKKTIDDLVKDHTIVIIAHRLSTIIDADLIFVIHEGKVEARGTHKELLETCEQYRNLYQMESM